MLRDLAFVMGEVGQPHRAYRDEVTLLRAGIVLVVLVAGVACFEPPDFLSGMAFGTGMSMVVNGFALVLAKRTMRRAQLNALIGYRARRLYRERQNHIRP